MKIEKTQDGHRCGYCRAYYEVNKITIQNDDGDIKELHLCDRCCKQLSTLFLKNGIIKLRID